MAPDPFEGPSNEPNPDRSRPVISAGYDGECFCGIEYYTGDDIRATADGAGWEAVDHDHDPEESAPQDAVEVGRLPLPAPPAGLYAVDVPTDAELRAALGSGHPDVEAETSTLLAMTMTERGIYLNPPQDQALEPDQYSCPECPKTFAPTKDKRVRTHKRLSDGERCSGSRAVPVELAATTSPEFAPAPPVPASAPHAFSTDPEAVAVLERAAAGSAQVAASVDRLANGRAGMVAPTGGPWPDAADPESDPAEVMYNRVNGLVPAPPEDAPDVAHDAYEKRLDAAFPPATPMREVIANPDVDRVALYTPRPAEPEPTAENGGRDPVWGRYILPHPKTGNGRQWRRATTFAGQLDDTYNLDAWQKRHLVRGAAIACAQDPQRLARAASWDVRRDKDSLNELAEALMTESGVHTAAEQGTLVHALTEGVDRASDAGEAELAWSEIPPQYAVMVQAYQQALTAYGLRVVPSLLERRTAVVEYGVAGTFDQVCEVVQLQDWSRAEGLNVGDFVVTDKKTGSDMSYGTGTHGIQLWLYARGINTCGVWDAFTSQWTHPVTVREDVGIIVHIPLFERNAAEYPPVPMAEGKCTLHALNLVRGREGAVLTQQGYDRAKQLRSQALKFSRPIGMVTVPPSVATPPVSVAVEAPVSQPVAAPAPAADPMKVWRDRLATVTTEQQAFAAYLAAKEAGMPAELLAGYQTALQGRLAPPAQQQRPEPVADPMTPWLQRAAQVSTPQQAGDLFTQAQAAGMPEPGQLQLREALERKLALVEQRSAAVAPPAPDILSESYWTPQAMQVTDPGQAKGLYDAMIAAGVPDGVKAAVSQRMKDWLESQARANTVVAQELTPAIPAMGDQAPAASPEWDAAARHVITVKQAGALFAKAQQAPGMTEQRLADLTAVMQAALSDQPPF